MLVGRGRVSNISLRRRRGEDLGVRVWLISDISFSLGDICWNGGVSRVCIIWERAGGATWVLEEEDFLGLQQTKLDM